MDAVSVRLPSAIAASGIIVLLFLFLWKNHDLYAAILGPTILLTCIHFGWLARIGRIDMAMAFFTTSSVMSFYQAGKSSGKIKLILLLSTYGSILISVLMKGLPALVLVLPLFAVWMFFDGFHNEAKKDVCSWFAYFVKKVGEYRLVSGLLAVLVLSFIYFYWINKQSEGKFFEVFLGIIIGFAQWVMGRCDRIPPGFMFISFLSILLLGLRFLWRHCGCSLYQSLQAFFASLVWIDLVSCHVFNFIHSQL